MLLVGGSFCHHLERSWLTCVKQWLAHRICQQFVDPTSLDVFTACRLVALDKCPGVRPIGIGEVVRRIIGKAVLAAAGPQVQEVTGALQVYAGQRGGSEAAVHAMRHILQDANSEAVLLVDATNAFNSLNRQVALQNVLHLCPTIALAIVNTYRADAQLFVDGEVIYSREGTTQGDPLAMACNVCHCHYIYLSSTNWTS